MKTIDVWKEALQEVWREGYSYVDDNNRNAKEKQNLIIRIENVDEAEVDEPLNKISKSQKWLYPSKEEITNVMFKEYQSPAYDYTYGGRLFNFSNELDQINNYIIPLLKKNKETRRALLCFYNPLKDSKINNRNVPAILYTTIRILDGKLHLTGLIRSTDLFFGWPANIYQLYYLQKYLAERTNYKIGNLTTISNNAHIFDSSLDDMKDLFGEDL